MRKWLDTQLTEYSCNLCGLQSDRFIFERIDGLRVVQCKECGLVYLNPRPKDDLIPTQYDCNYILSRSSIGDMLTASKGRLLVLKENGISSFGKALEVGCSTGEFCQYVHNRGVDVTGIDISGSAIKIARSRYKTIPFYVGTIDNIISEESYEALFAFEVIEHVHDPDMFFKKASDLLEKNGFLCITTPSFECAEFVGFDNWVGFSMSFEHLYFFSSTTIGKYAAKHGMQVVCTLYGGGKGLNSHMCNQYTIKEMSKYLLKSMHLLESVRRIKRIMQLTLPIKHDYQSKEIRHNLLMILQKQ
ncbi:MAG: class I SAM-dependent methyltransferase [Desulfobacterales bacterium]|nr:class I SAM-dependent methyltransferase [Desulfobacterales bacterium]